METDVRVIVASNENLQEAYKREGSGKIYIIASMSSQLNIPPLYGQRKGRYQFVFEFFLQELVKNWIKKLRGFWWRNNAVVHELWLAGNLHWVQECNPQGCVAPATGKINSNVLPWGNYWKRVITQKKYSESLVSLQQQQKWNRATIRFLKDAAAQAEYNTIMECWRR